MFSFDYPAVLLAIAHMIVGALTENKGYYRAAVLEHVRFGSFTDEKSVILEKNLGAYETAARIASKENADIIVYPEWGVYPHDKQNRTSVSTYAEDIPDPKTTFSNPCEQQENFKNRPILLKLSCIAKENNIFLVANIGDYKKCSDISYCDADDANLCENKEKDCPEDGFYLHNTNVVFNRDGTLITRYYKRHLFFEFDMNPFENPEDAYFDTDFGRFTTFVCFDMVFKESVQAIEKSNVLNVAYPTYWFDHFPLTLFASPFQQAWAMTNKVNLLASNAHIAGTGTMGSGIYSASQGALIYTHDPDGRSKLLISNVPNVEVEEPLELNTKRFVIGSNSAIEEKGEKISSFQESECELNVLGPPTNYMTDYRCFPTNTTEYKFTKLEKEENVVESCANNICCSLSYKTEKLEEDYFLGIFNSKFVFYDAWSFGTEGCFLTRCNSEDSGKCTNFVLKSSTVFQHVDIRGNFSAKYVYPYVIDSDVRLTDKKQWKFDDRTQIVYNNPNGKSSLLFLALYGRHYDQDETLSL